MPSVRSCPVLQLLQAIGGRAFATQPLRMGCQLCDFWGNFWFDECFKPNVSYKNTYFFRLLKSTNTWSYSFNHVSIHFQSQKFSIYSKYIINKYHIFVSVSPHRRHLGMAPLGRHLAELRHSAVVRLGALSLRGLLAPWPRGQLRAWSRSVFSDFWPTFMEILDISTC